MASTIKDIAEQTGLAISTISKYINGGNVLPENQVKIQEAIEKLNFSVNPFARSMKTHKSYIIGMIISLPNEGYINNLFVLMQKKFMDYGYYCLSITCEKNEQSQKKATEYMLNKNIDGLLFFDMFVHMNDFSQFNQKPIPILSIGCKPKNEKCDQVRFDDFLAISTITSYYLAKNKKIAYIASDINDYTQVKRFEGFQDAFNKTKISLDDAIISFGKSNGDDAYTRMTEILNSNNRPEAIIVADSNLTIGTSMAMMENGIIPKNDIALSVLETNQFPLTLSKKTDLLSLPIQRVCTISAKILLEKIENNQDIFESIQIPYQLIITE